MKITNKKLSLYIAFIYVVSATFYAFWATYNMVIDGVFYYIFLPATLIPSLIIFTEREPLLAVLVVQTITLGIVYLFALGFVTAVRDKYKTKENKD